MKKLVIDGHSHVTVPIEKHIRLMDEAGIDKTILFRTMVHPELQSDQNGIKKEMQLLQEILSGNPVLSKKYGEAAYKELFDVTQRYAERFYCFGTIALDLGLVDMIKNIQKQINEYHILGLGEFSIPSGQASILENVFNASSQTANLPIWIHCFNPIKLNDLQQIEILAQKYPSVPVIIGYAGGSNWMETIDIVKRNSNIYIDTSASFSSLVLKIIIEELPDKTFWGVDYPYGDMWINRKMIERVCPDKNIQQKVLGGNIMNLLKLA